MNLYQLGTVPSMLLHDIRQIPGSILVTGQFQNLLKFSQNQNFKDFLLSTGDKILVEASPYDRIWGIGMLETDNRAENPLLWNGENLLGFALMEVRDQLRR